MTASRPAAVPGQVPPAPGRPDCEHTVPLRPAPDRWSWCATLGEPERAAPSHRDTLSDQPSPVGSCSGVTLHDFPAPRVEPASDGPAASDQPQDCVAGIGARLSCPRCHRKLISPETLGWCPGCGYCKAVEREEAARKAGAVGNPRRHPGLLPALGELLAPAARLTGSLLGALLAVPWLLVQEFAGLAQCLALVLCGLGAFAGLFYWLHADPSGPAPAASADGPVLSAGKPGLDTRTHQEAEEAEATRVLQKLSAASSRKDTVPCLVIGYLSSADGELSGLALATLQRDRLAYAGVVPVGSSRAARKTLLRRLSGLERSAPLLRGADVAANWVRPGVYCHVHYSGTDGRGRLQDLRFEEFAA